VSNFIPKALKRVLLTILSIFLLSLTISQALDIKEKLKPQKTITFSGQGKVIGIPDVAEITFSVTTGKETTKEAITENTQKMNGVVKFIKDSGVDEKDIKTQSYSLSPRYDWIEGKRVFRGYELISTLAVKIRNLEKISEIIDGAILRGANQVGDIQFVIDNPEKLKQEAMKEAIKNAKERAQSIATISGLKIGKIVNFSEGVDVLPQSRPYFFEKTAESAAADTAFVPAIEKGSQEIIVNVSLTFELR
jgi:hypothetical protein